MLCSCWKLWLIVGASCSKPLRITQRYTHRHTHKHTEMHQYTHMTTCDVHGHKHIAQPVVCMKKLNCAHMSHTDRLECELTNPKKKPPPPRKLTTVSLLHTSYEILSISVSNEVNFQLTPVLIRTSRWQYLKVCVCEKACILMYADTNVQYTGFSWEQADLHCAHVCV